MKMDRVLMESKRLEHRNARVAAKRAGGKAAGHRSPSGADRTIERHGRQIKAIQGFKPQARRPVPAEACSGSKGGGGQYRSALRPSRGMRAGGARRSNPVQIGAYRCNW